MGIELFVAQMSSDPYPNGETFEQDRLIEGLLKIKTDPDEDSDYVPVCSTYGKRINGKLIPFAPAIAQNELEKGKIRLITGNYLDINDLEVIESVKMREKYPYFRDMLQMLGIVRNDFSSNMENQ